MRINNLEPDSLIQRSSAQMEGTSKLVALLLESRIFDQVEGSSRSVRLPGSWAGGRAGVRRIGMSIRPSLVSVNPSLGYRAGAGAGAGAGVTHPSIDSIDLLYGAMSLGRLLLPATAASLWKPPLIRGTRYLLLINWKRSAVSP